VPWIEAEGNRILAELGTPYRVELRTQAANKTNAVLRETLDVIVSDGDSVRAYETFSGGEKHPDQPRAQARARGAARAPPRRRVAGALHRRARRTRRAGMDRLADVLRGLAGTFERVIVVSHQPQLATAFDSVIAVEKTDGRSQIAGAREEVAA
jgi:DNA repair exonuclease SbcCD ATPase subunit